MATPTPAELRVATGISQSYASMILSGGRQPARPLAIYIFRRTGWRHDSIADLTEAQIATLETVEPWSPRPTSRSKRAVARPAQPHAVATGGAR